MGQTSFYSRHYTPTWPPIPLRAYNDPDSHYWRGEAELIGKMLERAMGSEAFDEWYDQRDDTPTWRSLYDQLKAKLDEVENGK